ncbi:MAG: ABC transporter permease [Defluviitaleaceae bacterium]|nr:ABC transporter permease [Defluviitaleaceae bacterium]
MDMFYFVMQRTMFFTIPLLIVALGGLFSEKSGIVNIALEGKMVLGAFAGVMFMRTIQGGDSFLANNPTILLLVALVIAAATGIGTSLFHAFASINLKANQIISGVAINMFAPAFAIFYSIYNTGNQNVFFSNQFMIDSVPGLGRIPFIGPILFQDAYVTTYLGFLILVISVFVLYKTKFGLRLRACGEHPHAADSVGVSVTKIRYAGVLISGGLAGMGGLIWAIPSSLFAGAVNGYGFLALAVLIFGAWKPQRILVAALFFGFMQTIAAAHTGIDILPGAIPSQFYRMLPFVATLVILAFTSKNTMAPKAVGQPYDKGGR